METLKTLPATDPIAQPFPHWGEGGQRPDEGENPAPAARPMFNVRYSMSMVRWRGRAASVAAGDRKTDPPYRPVFRPAFDRFCIRNS